MTKHQHRRFSDREGNRTNRVSHALSDFAQWVTNWTGSSSAFAMAAAIVIIWLMSGPFFHYSDTWQLVINTGTTIVTFLMVFLIQREQNRSSLAVQLKLNELVAAVEGASNRLISVEDLTEEELMILTSHYRKLAEMAATDGRLTQSHSIEEAEQRHAFKRTEEGRRGRLERPVRGETRKRRGAPTERSPARQRWVPRPSS
jgi:low affinity Fe/Cu permease